jgi:hypothetical protein
MPQIRLSASRIKEVLSCSWLFYCKEVLKLPETTHPKTLVGSLCHSILECLLNPRHKKHYLVIMAGKKSVYNSEAVTRLIKWWQKKYNLEQKLINDVDAMVLLVLTQTNYLDEGATKTFPPEQEFNLIIGGKYPMRGFLDRLAIFGDKIIITDYKTQGKVFTQEELDNNIQASVYQSYCKKQYGLPAEVQFIMLRHPPTRVNATKHIQTVPSKTDSELAGIECYLEFMGQIFSNFTEEDAKKTFKCDIDDGFCWRVCQFRQGRDYKVKLDKEGNIIAGYSINNEPEFDANEGEKIEVRSYKGCPRFN